MSVGPSSAPAPGLPPVNQALEPSWVRDGPAATQKAYALAQGFEEMLVQELSQAMAKTSGLAEEGDPSTGETGEGGESAGTSASTSELSSLLPQALSESVMGAGGLGLAAQMTRELQPPSPRAHVGADGGTRA